MTRLVAGDPRHGTVNGYANCGCRCAACREAWRAGHADYMRRHPEQARRAAARKRQRRELVRWGVA